jgi:LPS export ABC transporter protein LptC
MTKLGLNILKQSSRIVFPGILFLSLWLSSCKNDPDEIAALVTKNTIQEDKAKDVTILYSENGQTKVRMFAKEFIRNEVAKPPFVDMKHGLKVEFFNDSLIVNSTLTAKYARYYEKQGNVLIRDSVVVVNKKGERLETEELIWNQNVKKIYTEKFVKVHTPTQIMFGNGLEANEDFSWYVIKNPTGIVQVDKAEMPE